METASWPASRRAGDIVPIDLTYREISVLAYIAAGTHDGPTLTVLGAVHGDEYEGPVAIAALLAALPVHEVAGTLLAVPVVNGPAYAAGMRTDPADEKDLARCFPGDPDGSASMQRAHLIARECIAPADALIDLHSGGVAIDGALLIGYTATTDTTGARSRELAYAFGAPVIWEHPPPMPPGRTGSFALDRGIPFIYTEATGGGGAQPDVIDCFRSGVLRVMIALGMLPGAAPEPRHREVWRGGGNTDEMAAASAPGLFRAQARAGEFVTAGTLVGEIVDGRGQIIAQFHAPRDGMLAFVRRVPRVRPGDGLFLLTERIAE